MFVKYGNYTSANNEARLETGSKMVFSPAGLATSEIRTWQIIGRLHGTDISDLTTKANALITAYSLQNQDAYLLSNAGAQIDAAHSMITRNAIGGVRVTSLPSFPEGAGAQGSTYWDYRVTLEGTFPTSQAIIGLGGGTLVMQESLEITGDGGPEFVIREPLIGRPVPIQVKQYTKMTAVQSGFAESYGDYASPARPFAPQWIKRNRSSVRRTPPPRSAVGSNALRKYRIDWNYIFESDGINGNGF